MAGFTRRRHFSRPAARAADQPRSAPEGAATMTHDYKRNGTTTLFAALNVLDGQVIGQCQQHHTHVEWLKFLRQIDRETPKDKTPHLIADNYGTHKPAHHLLPRKSSDIGCSGRRSGTIMDPFGGLYACDPHTQKHSR